MLYPLQVISSRESMIQYNCSSPDSLYAAVEASWCSTREDECHNRTASQSDLCLSRSAYLEKYLGPCRSPFFLLMCVTYLLIFVVGVLGNSLTCIVIARHRVMRTITNYYLFSLAISDLLVLLLGLPLELYELWSNYPFLFGVAGCYFKTCLFETVCFASVLNVTALSVERYRAVVHPLQTKHVATHAHAKRVILVLWAVSLLCALPNTSLHGVETLKPSFGLTFPDSGVCMVVHDRWIYNLLVQVTALLFFILPMLTITVLYVLIGLQLHRERDCFDSKIGLNQDGEIQRARHRQVTKMLCECRFPSYTNGWKNTSPKNENIDELVYYSEKMWRNVALHDFLSSGCSAVNGCRQNESPNSW